MTTLRSNIRRAALISTFAVVFGIGATAFQPVAFASCGQAGGSGCKDSGAVEQTDDSTPTIGLRYVFQLLDVLGVLVP